MPAFERDITAVALKLDAKPLAECRENAPFEPIGASKLRVIIGVRTKELTEVAQIVDDEHCFNNRAAILGVDNLKEEAFAWV